MNQDELLKLLDLKNQDPTPTHPAPFEIMAGAPLRPEPSAHATVFPMDEWSLRRGSDLLEESDRLTKLNLDPFAIADFTSRHLIPIRKCFRIVSTHRDMNS